MEKPAVVAAPDKDADHLFLSVKVARTGTP
jgi:hypothetical protein